MHILHEKCMHYGYTGTQGNKRTPDRMKPGSRLYIKTLRVKEQCVITVHSHS